MAPREGGSAGIWWNQLWGCWYEMCARDGGESDKGEGQHGYSAKVVRRVSHNDIEGRREHVKSACLLQKTDI